RLRCRLRHRPTFHARLPPSLSVPAESRQTDGSGIGCGPHFASSPTTSSDADGLIEATEIHRRPHGSTLAPPAGSTARSDLTSSFTERGAQREHTVRNVR